MGSRIVCVSASSQRCMVTTLFWTAKSIGRFVGNYPFVGCHSCDAPIILENLSVCRITDGALLVVGEFRYGSQFRRLENESVKIDVIPYNLKSYATKSFCVKGPGKALEKKFTDQGMIY